jgi:AcrR family transcriptional regulator
MFCIEQYETRRWTNACQMVYLPIGMKSKTAPAPPGRPRAFDADVALERAMHVFWAKGYEGAVLSDLTQAMRINRPSLYAAFGNKGSSSSRSLIDMLMGHLLIFAKRWRHRRRGRLSSKFYSAPLTWRVIPAFHQDASWSKVRLRAEIRPDPFRKK